MFNLEKSRKYALAFSVFIIIIILASSLIVLVGSGVTGDENQPPASNSNSNTPSAPSVQFKADNVGVSVSEVFPQVILVGQTQESNYARIDSELALVDGVKGIIQSSYVKIEVQGLTYKAELALDPNANVAEVVGRIVQNSKLLSNVEAVAVGLVELPSSIEVVNSDLNLSKTFTPEQHFAEAFLSVSTLKGDLIKAALNVSFANEVSSNLQVFESENLASQPQFFSVSVKARIVSLESKLLVQGEMGFENYVGSNALRDSLSFQDFAVNSLNVQELQKSMVVRVSGVQSGFDTNTVRDAITAAGLNGVSSFEVGSGEGSFSIDIALADNADLNSLESSIKSILLQASIQESQASFERPSAGFMLDLNLTAGNSLASFNFLQDFFSPKSIKFQAFQSLTTDLNSVFVQDLNSSLAIDGNSLQVFAKPGHSLDEEVSFTLQVQVLRGRIVQAQGVEE